MRIFRSLFFRVFIAFFAASFAASAVLMIAERALEPPSDRDELGDTMVQQTDALVRLAVALADAEGVEIVERALNDDDGRVVIALLGDKFASPEPLLRRDEATRDLLSRAPGPRSMHIAWQQGRFNVAQRVQVGDRTITFFVDDYTVDPPNPMRNPLAKGLVIVFVSGLACLALATSVTRPMKRLSRALDRYGRGDLNSRYGPVRWRDEVGELGIRFDEMANRIQALIDSQHRLLCDISHELRSPLTRLQMALGIARNQPQEYQASLDRVELETNRLNQLIGELLTLARLESPAVEAWENVDVARMLTTIAEDARFEADSRAVVVCLSSVEGVFVHANVNLLYRALENLVRNAVKYTLPGTKVEIVLAEAAPDTTRDSEQCEITVRDRGPGIPAAELQAVLRPFVRSSKVSEDGVGLGLSIADRIIRQIGGTLTLSNAPGGGLLAAVKLPRANGAAGTLKRTTKLPPT